MIKIKSFVKFINTVDCLVAFRMSRAQMEAVRNFFGKSPEHRMVFKTGELACQGNGWWHAFGNDYHVNGALRVLQVIEFALNNLSLSTYRLQQQVRDALEKQRVQRVYQKAKKVFIPVAFLGYYRGRPQYVAKNRPLQASRNRRQAEIEIRDRQLIQGLLSYQAQPARLTHDTIAQLNAKFGH